MLLLLLELGAVGIFRSIWHINEGSSRPSLTHSTLYWVIGTLMLLVPISSKSFDLTASADFSIRLEARLSDNHLTG